MQEVAAAVRRWTVWDEKRDAWNGDIPRRSFFPPAKAQRRKDWEIVLLCLHGDVEASTPLALNCSSLVLGPSS